MHRFRWRVKFFLTQELLQQIEGFVQHVGFHSSDLSRQFHQTIPRMRRLTTPSNSGPPYRPYRSFASTR